MHLEKLLKDKVDSLIEIHDFLFFLTLKNDSQQPRRFNSKRDLFFPYRTEYFKVKMDVKTWLLIYFAETQEYILALDIVKENNVKIK